MIDKKRRLWLMISAALSVVILVLVVLLQGHDPSPQYKEYRDYATYKGLRVFSEEEAAARATDLCAWFDRPDVIDFPPNYTVSFILEKDVVPLVSSYCPRNSAMAYNIAEYRGYGQRG